MPSIVMVKVIWITDVLLPKSACISGSEGKYISVANGAMAAKIPKKTIINFLFIYPRLSLEFR